MRAAAGNPLRAPPPTSTAQRRHDVEIQPTKPSTKGPAEMFSGDVWFDVIAQGETPSRRAIKVLLRP